MDVAKIESKLAEEINTFAKKVFADGGRKTLMHSPDFSEFDQPILTFKKTDRKRDIKVQPDHCLAFRISFKGWVMDHKGYAKLTEEIQKKIIGDVSRRRIPDIDGDGKKELFEEYVIKEEIPMDVKDELKSPVMCDSSNWEVSEPFHQTSVYIFKMSKGAHIVVKGIATFLSGDKKS